MPASRCYFRHFPLSVTDGAATSGRIEQDSLVLITYIIIFIFIYLRPLKITGFFFYKKILNKGYPKHMDKMLRYVKGYDDIVMSQ